MTVKNDQDLWDAAKTVIKGKFIALNIILEDNKYLKDFSSTLAQFYLSWKKNKRTTVQKKPHKG